MGNKKKTTRSGFIFYVNKYTICLAGFIVWIVFFDNHNLITQYKLKGIINELEGQKSAFESKYEAALAEKKALEQDKEKYAREKYYMHKDNEEVFIIK